MNVMKSVFKFIFLFLPLLAFMSCGDDDDAVHDKNLKSYFFDECVLGINEYVVLDDRTDVDNFIDNYISRYRKNYGEEPDLESNALIKHLQMYNSMFFRNNGVVLRGVEATAHIHYEVDGVWVSTEEDVLNIDISQIIRGDRKYCSTILVECTDRELDRDIVWNIASSYED